MLARLPTPVLCALLDHDGDHDPGHDEDHGACSLIAATAGGSTPVGTLSATAPATAGPSAPLVAAFGPRGPPILAYAAKTSPPTA